MRCCGQAAPCPKDAGKSAIHFATAPTRRAKQSIEPNWRFEPLLIGYKWEGVVPRAQALDILYSYTLGRTLYTKCDLGNAPGRLAHEQCLITNPGQRFHNPWGVWIMPRMLGPDSPFREKITGESSRRIA